VKEIFGGILMAAGILIAGIAFGGYVLIRQVRKERDEVAEQQD
jgi:hypothetical protein